MDKKSSDLAKQIQQDHEDLKKEMNLLKQEIQKEVTPGQFGKWRMEFLWRLRDFKNDMLKHFDLEELSDFPNELRKLAPHYMSRFEDIKTDHQKIIIDLEEILQALKSLDEEDAKSFSDIRQKISNLISFIHAHEAEERELLEDTYLQDYGAND
jgi:iron-sulfur cluster repair protein YtfE (RIC family)